MPISQTKSPSYIFMHPPKTAGSSINKWLEESDKIELCFGVTQCREDPINYPKHPSRPIVEKLFSPLGQVVCPIRNTWDRIVSNWCYFNSGSEVTGKQGYSSFEQFISQNNTRMYCLMDYYREGDIILRHDRLEKDFKQIQDIFQDYRPLPIYNVTSQKLDYRDVYTSATKDIVYKRLKKEIDHFGFEF